MRTLPTVAGAPQGMRQGRRCSGCRMWYPDRTPRPATALTVHLATTGPG
jgi:hypothetical protein